MRGAPAAMGRKRAVLVGINYPGRDDELKGCFNDVTRMRRCLVERFGFDEADIRVLADADPTTPAPTGANIRQELERLVWDARPGDTLFFHYSGHGMQLPAETGEDDDTGYDECIVPCDGNLIKEECGCLQRLARQVNGAKIVMDGPSLNECALGRVHQIIEVQRQPSGEAFRDELAKTMNQDFKELVAKVPDGCIFTIVSDSCHSGGLIDKAKEQIGNSTRQNKTEHPDPERVTRYPFGAIAFLLRIVHGVLDSLGIPRLVQSGGTETNTKAGAASTHATSIKSQSLPMPAFIKMLRETTGEDDVGVGTIRTTLFRHFGDDASPKIKKFVQVMAGNKLRQDGKRQGQEVDGDGVKEVYAGTTASAPPLPLNGVLISGCQTDQTSGDATTAEGVSYGLLSNAVQTILARKRDGTVTNRELVLKARELLSKQGVTSQQPGLHCSDEHASLAFIC